MRFLTIHQSATKSCVTPSVLKMGFRYRNLSFFAGISTKTSKNFQRQRCRFV